jgi:hypothetical protein
MEILDGLPVLLARNISKTSAKTAPCPYCGRQHIHGAGEVNTLHHKVAHCPPLESISPHNFRDVWKRIKHNPALTPTLKNNPGYYVKIVR